MDFVIVITLNRRILGRCSPISLLRGRWSNRTPLNPQNPTHAPCLYHLVRSVMTVDPSQPQHPLPIYLRPARTWAQTLNGVFFLLLFVPGCFMVHGFQLLFVLPLKLVPGPRSRRLYDEGIRYSKGAFAALLSASFSGFTLYVYERHVFTSQI